MVLVASQKMAVNGSAHQRLPVGFDGGNGSIKLVIDGQQIRCPSYILPVHGEVYDYPESGFVEYVGGDRADLAGQRWFAGFSAYQQSPTSHLRTVDNRKGKLQYGLQMFLGGLSALPWRSSWQLSVVASIQDAQAFGSELKQLLQGFHSVRFNGLPDLTTISIDILTVTDEGVGAIAECRSEINPNGQTLIYDFGAGTAIISVFGAKGKLINRKVTAGGVENLIDAIAKNLETRRQLATEGDRQIIRAGIEDGSFNYGQSGWNFRTVYDAELKPWVGSVLAVAIKAAAPWTPTSNSILAVGGGSQLPTISQLLVKHGITPIAEGCWVNARGLAAIARAMKGV